MNIGILDYGVGNNNNVIKTIIKLNCSFTIVTNEEDLDSVDKLILPGVGAFSTAMKNLNKNNMVEQINEFYKKGKSILGICLGMQLLFKTSYEFEQTDGLGLLAGKVIHLKPKDSYPVPNYLNNSPECILTKGLESYTSFYFNHSMHCQFEKVKEGLKVLSTNYGPTRIVSLFEYRNIYGTQFHPELSSETGLIVLNNFLKG